MTIEMPRLARGVGPQCVPRAVDGEPGIFAVDATWGVIQPISLARGVRTVGEFEVIEHLRAGRPILDCRLPEYVKLGTIPGAVNVPHELKNPPPPQHRGPPENVGSRAPSEAKRSTSSQLHRRGVDNSVKSS